MWYARALIYVYTYVWLWVVFELCTHFRGGKNTVLLYFCLLPFGSLVLQTYVVEIRNLYTEIFRSLNVHIYVHPYVYTYMNIHIWIHIYDHPYMTTHIWVPIYEHSHIWYPMIFLKLNYTPWVRLGSATNSEERRFKMARRSTNQGGGRMGVGHVV